MRNAYEDFIIILAISYMVSVKGTRNGKKSTRFKSRHGMEEDEYLSRMKKTDKLVPVITIVVYYGGKPWDGAKSLHEMLEIPEDMRPFVNDYKILLVEARENHLIFHSKNNIAFFHLMKLILDEKLTKNKAKEKVIDYAREHNVDKTVIMTIAGATKCKIDYDALSKKGDFDMCTLFDRIARESETVGILKGEAKAIIELGLEFGLNETDILERLQRKLNLSLETAREYLEIFGNV